MSVRVLEGDCREVMAGMDAESVDAIVTDPPYGIGFMGREWDAFSPEAVRRREKQLERKGPYKPSEAWPTKRGAPRVKGGGAPISYDESLTGNRAFQAWCEAWATEGLRVLKPGGHLLAFGGTRTYHRLAVAIEDAGFEIRDSIGFLGLLGWVFGSGFPKSLNVGKALDDRTDDEIEAGVPLSDLAARWSGFGTALKPAWEPIVLARKPLGVPAVNVLSMVESSLRERGVEEIRWSTQPVELAAKPSRRPTLFRSRPTQTASECAAHASDGVMPLTESGIESGSGASITNESTATPARGANTARTQPPRSVAKLSTPTEDDAPAAESASRCSSHSITSTAEERSTVSLLDDTSTNNSRETDSLTDTESYAGIATGLTGSLAHVRIERNSDGSFLWPDNLPRFVAASSTVAANVTAHGTGVLNIDGCRIGGTKDVPASPRRAPRNAAYGELGNDPGTGSGWDANIGRWPANVVLDEAAAMALDASVGELRSGAWSGRRKTPKTQGIYGAFESYNERSYEADTGGPSRFFYCAKASRAERNAGLEGMPERVVHDPEPNGRAWDIPGSHSTARANHHPTVKPVDLMRWLVRLVTPPGGLVLDPFMGSGTTGVACVLEGLSFVGIEREAEYAEIARRRIARAQGPLFAEVL